MVACLIPSWRKLRSVPFLYERNSFRVAASFVQLVPRSAYLLQALFYVRDRANLTLQRATADGTTLQAMFPAMRMLLLAYNAICNQISTLSIHLGNKYIPATGKGSATESRACSACRVGQQYGGEAGNT